MNSQLTLPTKVQPTASNLDSPLRGDIQGERNMAAYPFFALSKTPQHKPLVFQQGNVKIEVRASSRGVATIYDKEVLLYLASLIAEAVNQGKGTEKRFTFTAHDYFRVVGSNRSARSYERLQAAIERLQGSQIRTSIQAGGKGSEGFFSWITEAHIEYDETKDKKRLKSISLTVCEWLLQAIVRDQRTLVYHHGYFDLGAIERRMYEVAHAADYFEGQYTTTVEDVFERLGSSEAEIGKFRHHLRDIASRQPLPEYHLELVPNPERPRGVLLRFSPKKKTDHNLNLIAA